MPAIVDLTTKRIEFRCEDDAECIREKDRLLHETPRRRLKLIEMQYGSYKEWRDPAKILDGYEAA